MIGVLVIAAVAVALAAMRAQSQGPAAPAPASSAPAASVAVVEGESISAAELDKAAGAELDKLEQQIYDVRVQRLDAMIGDKLLANEAKRRGVTVDSLVASEITAKTTGVSDADVDAFYEQNKARLPQQPNIRDQIRQFLTEQRVVARRDEFVGELRARGNVSVSLSPPPVTRQTIRIDGAPSRGPANAKITLIEFSDFHCPFCRRVQPTLTELLKRYPDQIKLVFKDMPLDELHPQARRAAEAARCANDQGQFWPYRARLFERGPDASDAALTAIATEIKIDVPAFEKCLASGVHKAGVQQDLAEAQALGLTGTPAFFLNGRLIPGAQPLEAFVRMVDEELAGRVRAR